MKKIFLLALFSLCFPLFSETSWDFRKDSVARKWELEAPIKKVGKDGLYIYGPAASAIRYRFNTPLDADVYKALEIEFFGFSENSMRMEFAADKKGNTSESVAINIPNLCSGGRIIRRIRCADHPEWKGKIGQIRLRPVTENPGSAKIVRMRFLTDIPKAPGCWEQDSESIVNGSFEDHAWENKQYPDGWKVSGNVVFSSSAPFGKCAAAVVKGSIEQFVELRTANGSFDLKFTWHTANGSPAFLDLEYFDIFGKKLDSQQIRLNGDGKWQNFVRNFTPSAETAGVNVKFTSMDSRMTLDGVSLIPKYPADWKYYWTPSRWIWSGENEGSCGKTVYFRRVLDIADHKKVDAALLQLQSRSMYFKLPFGAKVYVNGTEVAAGDAPGEHEWTHTYDLKPYLVSGKNVIAMSENQRYASAGLLPDLFIQQSGTPHVFDSSQWQSSETFYSDWNQINTVGKFVPAHIWKDFAPGFFCRVYYRYPGISGIIMMKKFDLPDQVDAEREYDLSIPVKVFLNGEKGIVSQAALRPVTVSEDGRITTRMGKILCENKMTSLNMPLVFKYHKEGKYSFRIYADRMEFADIPAGFTYNRTGNFIEKKIYVRGRKNIDLASVRISGVKDGNPQMTVNGKNIPVHRFTHGSFTQNVTEASMAIANDTYECGGQVIGLHYNNMRYIGNGKFDFSETDSLLTSLLANRPDRYIVLHWTMDSRSSRGPLGDWVWENEKDWAKTESGSTDTAGYYSFKNNPQVSAASPARRKLFNDMTRQLVRHIKNSAYADRVIAIAPSAFGAEWFLPGSMDRFVMDYSEPFQQAFRSWVQKKYNNSIAEVNKAWGKNLKSFAEVVVPSKKERFGSSHPDYLIRPFSANAIDYHEFLCVLNTGTMKEICRLIKEESDGRMLTGVYYGYSLWAVSYLHATTTGHAGLGMVVDSPDIDFFMAPPRYADRGAGGASGLQGPVAEIRINNKLVINEADNRLLHSWNNNGRTPGLYDSAAVVAREFGFTLATGGGMAWLEFGEGWLSLDPRLRAMFKKCMAQEKVLSQRGIPRIDTANSIAVVYDEKTIWSIPDDALTMMQELNFYKELLRTGCGVQWYLADDLEKLTQYKCIVFASSAGNFNEKQRKFIDENLRKDGRILVFLNAAGLYNSGNYSPRSVSEFSRIKSVQGMVPGRLALVRTDSKNPMLKYLPENFSFNFPDRQWQWFHSVEGEGDVLFRLEYKGSAPAVTVKSFGDWTAVHSAAGSVPAALLRGIAETAGINIFNRHDGDTTYAANRFYCVYTSGGGARSFYPGFKKGKAVDLLTGISYDIADGVFRAVLKDNSCYYFMVTPAGK